MKKLIYALFATAMAVACQEGVKSEGGGEPTSESITIAITTADNTRTHLDTESNMVRWDGADRLMVIENDMRYATSGYAQVDDAGRARFDVVMSKDTTAESYYYDAIYPAESVNFDEGVYGELVKVMLPAEQHPTTTSFDPAADILVSKRQSFTSQPESLDMRFKRLVAMCALTLDNMPEGSTIKELHFSVDNDAILAGCNLINCLMGTVEEYGYASPSSTIHIIYDTPNDASQPIYFTSNPLTLGPSDSFTLRIECGDGTTYIRTVTIPAGRTLTFGEGDLAHFTVDMSTEDCSYLFRRTSSVTSGKKYLLAAQEYIAVPITSEYDYIQVTEGDSDNDGEILLDNLDNAYIITSKDEGYTIQQHYDGRYLYQQSKFNNFNLSTSPTSGEVWDIEYNHEDDNFMITNISANKFIQYHGYYNSFGSYSSMQSEGVLPALYEWCGYVIGTTPTPEEPDTPITPDDPDTPESTIAEWLELPAERGDNAYPSAVTVTVYDGSERNYTHYYDRSTYTSLWVAYPLESKHMGSFGRPDNWDWNPYISTSDQVDLRSHSYATGYSRGHLIPNASRNGIKNMQLQTFYVTNSVPQIQDNFNGGIWQKLEAALQAIGEREKIYIVTGVAFNKVGETKSIKYAKAKDDTKNIPVPNYFYKVAMKVTTNSSGAVTDACTIGFWFEHKTYTDSYTNYTTTVDQIEAWTGFDFFANLPDNVETTAEGNSTWSTFSAF